jgi:hypothetical protein
MTASANSISLGPFVPGVGNRRPESKMRGTRADGGDFLRSAVNVDITNQGSVKRRAGYAQVSAGTDCHSFWADAADAFMVDGSTLNRVTGLPGTPVLTTMRTGLVPGRSVSYARAPTGAVYFSNGVEIGRLSAAGARPVCTPGLTVRPAVSASADGSLPAGRYGLCFSHLDAAGEESPTTVPQWVECPANGRIAISDTRPLPTGATAWVVYMTLPNDSVFQRVVVAATPNTTVIASLQQGGARSATLLLSPMPAGDIVRCLSGRLLVAKGSVLYFSEPYMFGLFNPTRGFIQFPSDITVMETTSGGTWVCADQTYWFGGLDIAAAEIDAKTAYGGVSGSGGAVPNDNDVFWMSPRGVMRGSQDGVLKNLQEERVAVAPSGFSAGAFREVDGLKQFVESTFAAEPNRMAAASYMDAEIVRKGVTL